MRRPAKDHAARNELLVRRRNVRRREIENRLAGRTVLLAARKKKPCAAAIEEGEVTIRIEMRKAEHVLVPFDGLRDVRHLTRDLSDRSQLQFGCRDCAL